MLWALAAVGVVAAAVFLYDFFVSDDNILRNFPLIGHLRYLLIELGPELRQYIVAGNHEEMPFNREERDWIYRSAKGENNYFGFGTDDNLLTIGYHVIKHAQFPYGEVGFTGSAKDHALALPCAKILGEVRDRAKAWRPRSIVNISAMSYGSLSGKAVEALNRGAALAGCYHNTGEGGLSPHHRTGADVIYQIGTGYFGCRTLEGRFSLETLQETLALCPTVRGIEVKLSQGAKPGKGGVLPGRKVTAEIAAIRGVAQGKDCISPNNHTAFHNVRSMIEFIERIAKETGLPVGIKSAVGQMGFWHELAQAMRETREGPDWITIDGGEGGTGAAPLTFADHVSLPFRVGFPRVYKALLEEGVADRVAWIGSARLGFPDRAVVALSLGADLINVAREGMLAIGCIQAQKCHTDFCPTGVATHKAYLQRGLVVEVQMKRLQRYCESFRNELLALTHACGYEHPSQYTADDVEVSSGPGLFSTLRQIYGYTPSRRWKKISG